MHHRSLSVSCPHCRQRAEWSGDGLGCPSCQRYIPPPRSDAPAWERLAEAGDYDEYNRLSPHRIEREQVLADDRFDEIARRRARPLEVEDVRAIFAAAVPANPSPVEVEIIGALALLLWGATPKLGRSWYRKDPMRPAFGSLGAALRALHELGDAELGMCGGTSYQTARTRGWTRARTLRSGIMFVNPTRNGSTGGVRGAVAIELRADLERVICGAGVSADDVRLLCLLSKHGKGGRAKVTEIVLRERGELPKTLKPSQRKAKIDAALPEVAGRIERATGPVEKALRALARHAPAGWEEAPLLRPRKSEESETTDQVRAIEPTQPMRICA